MKIASGIRRFSCFVSDVSLLVGLYYLSLKIAELSVPAADLYPPMEAMQLYSPRDFHIYFFGSLLGGLFYLVYHFVCYFGPGRTIGQILTQIKRVGSSGQELRARLKLRVIFFGFLKYLIVLSPGPAFALLGILGFAFSAFVLILPVLFLFINPLLCYFKPDKLSWFEKVSRTRLVSVAPGRELENV